VKIITVALGNDADNQELSNYATNEDFQVRAKNSEDPLELGKKIMELAFKSTYHDRYLGGQQTQNFFIRKFAFQTILLRICCTFKLKKDEKHIAL